jgi:molecular chaperone DnaK
MRTLLSQVKNDDDPLLKIQSMQKLRELTDEYPILITLFTVKMASDNAVKDNPSDGHRLLQMHDQIVNHFRNRRKDQAFSLLDEAIELRDKYSSGGLDLGGSIHLRR